MESNIIWTYNSRYWIRHVAVALLKNRLPPGVWRVFNLVARRAWIDAKDNRLFHLIADRRRWAATFPSGATAFPDSIRRKGLSGALYDLRGSSTEAGALEDDCLKMDRQKRCC